MIRHVVRSVPSCGDLPGLSFVRRCKEARLEGFGAIERDCGSEFNHLGREPIETVACRSEAAPQ
jgi:hypothetical protein